MPLFLKLLKCLTVPTWTLLKASTTSTAPLIEFVIEMTSQIKSSFPGISNKLTLFSFTNKGTIEVETEHNLAFSSFK